MEHVIYKGGKDQPVLVLLHGTGGTETSLLEVGSALNSQATLIGIRGNTLENGYPRFFKRLAEGEYDEVDLAERTIELHEFIQALLNKEDLSSGNVVLVGYSNGANIGIKLLLDYPKNYQKAVLFHPMYPVDVQEKQDLSQTQIFTIMGQQDPIVPVVESNRVLELLTNRGASVTEEWTLNHQLTFTEVEKAKEWLQ